MLRSMNTAITGLKMHQLYMDVIGNNISNVNTTAFKSGRITFQNLLSQTIRNSVAPTELRGGINQVQVGMGASVAGVEMVQTQGGFQTTAKVTDLAIQGDGFFVMTDGFQRFYTRDGSFDLDQNGNLISPNTGLKVAGWMADNGEIDNTRPPTGNINIALGQSVAARKTNSIELNGNLNGAATHIAKSGPVEYITESNAGASPTSGFDIVDGDTITFTYDGQTYTTPVGDGDATATPPVAATNGGLSAHPANSALKGNTTAAVAADIQTAMYTALVNAGKVAAGMALADMPIQVTVVDDGGLQGAEAYLQFTANKELKFGNAPSNNLNLSAALRNRASQGLQTVRTTVQVYDTLGNPHDIEVTFEKVTSMPVFDAAAYAAPPAHFTPFQPVENTWKWSVAGAEIDINGTDPSQPAGQTPPVNKLGGGWGYVRFDPTGNFQGADTRWIDNSTQTVTQDGVIHMSEPIAQGSKAIVKFNWNNGSVDGQEVLFDFSKVSELQDGNTVTESKNDGFATGTLLNFVIGGDGVIMGQYSNGTTDPLAQIALATFPNVAGLTQVGSNMFTESANSGLAQIGVPRTAGRGSINAGQLEMSNVDLAQQFTDMIKAQRGFQANSRIITTSDEMLQDLVNLKR
jgi:flagellar hook protein FlgE